jgi:hypothetical protein
MLTHFPKASQPSSPTSVGNMLNCEENSFIMQSLNLKEVNDEAPFRLLFGREQEAERVALKIGSAVQILLGSMSAIGKFVFLDPEVSFIHLPGVVGGCRCGQRRLSISDP